MLPVLWEESWPEADMFVQRALQNKAFSLYISSFSINTNSGVRGGTTGKGSCDIN